MSDEPQRLSASGDVIDALSDRVGELTKRVASLEAELDAARKRVAVYEEFDATVREALAGALRAAHQIRDRAERAAEGILEQARQERRLLLNEIERLREERDRLGEEIATARRGGISALRGPQRAVETPAQAASESGPELRTAAAEALRSVLSEVLTQIRQEASAAEAARDLAR